MTALQSQHQAITNLNQLDFNKLYTYEEYYTWQFPERVELIDGQLYHLFPGPNAKHQEISMTLSIFWGNFLNGKKCKVYAAPFDVRFPKRDGSKTNTVVQPDLCIICDLSKIEDRGINGAPDLVIEILSPSNSKREMTDKFNLYEREGVKEYWLIHPTEKWLMIYNLDNVHKYIGSKHFTLEDKNVASILFPDFNLDLERLFDV